MTAVCFGMRLNGICFHGPEQGSQNILTFISPTCKQCHPMLKSLCISDSDQTSFVQTLTVYIHLVEFIVRMTYL